MDGDLFLNWLSARRTGPIPEAAKTAASLFPGPPDIRAGRRYLSRLEDLGHIDLAWSSNKWRVRPRTLTHLPGSSAFALLAGERPAGFSEFLDVEFALHVIQPSQSDPGMLTDPSVLLLQYDAEADLQEIAETVKASFIPCAAVSVASSLNPIRPGPLSNGPNKFGSPIQMFTPPQRFADVETPRRDGLFRQLANGRPNYWILEHGTWATTTREEGICLINGKTRSDWLEFRPGDNDGEQVGTLVVDGQLPLPASHRRALTLSSGLCALEYRSGARHYRNVPSSVAGAVARSLHQQLRTTS